MAVQTRSVAQICADAKQASRALARTDSATRNAALEAIAGGLEARLDDVLEANALDVKAGEDAEISSALLDRLRLTPDRVAGVAPRTGGGAPVGGPGGGGVEGVPG